MVRLNIVSCDYFTYTYPRLKSGRFMPNSSKYPYIYRYILPDPGMSEEIKCWLATLMSDVNYCMMNTPKMFYEEICFTTNEDLIAFKFRWDSEVFTSCLIYPPAGWAYRFPKSCPAECFNDVEGWLINNGYPKYKINSNLRYRLLPGMIN